jgi:hypothetical protein
MLAFQAEFGVPTDEFRPFGGQPFPSRSHFQKLGAVLAAGQSTSHGPAFLGVLAVL